MCSCVPNYVWSAPLRSSDTFTLRCGRRERYRCRWGAVHGVSIRRKRCFHVCRGWGDCDHPRRHCYRLRRRKKSWCGEWPVKCVNRYTRTRSFRSHQIVGSVGSKFFFPGAVLSTIFETRNHLMLYHRILRLFPYVTDIRPDPKSKLCSASVERSCPSRTSNERVIKKKNTDEKSRRYERPEKSELGVANCHPYYSASRFNSRFNSQDYICESETFEEHNRR